MIKLNSTVRYTFNGSPKEKKIRFHRNEGDRGCITPGSPMGKAMLGRKVGDKLKVGTPGGVVDVEILDVS